MGLVQAHMERRCIRRIPHTRLPHAHVLLQLEPEQQHPARQLPPTRHPHRTHDRRQLRRGQTLPAGAGEMAQQLRGAEHPLRGLCGYQHAFRSRGCVCRCALRVCPHDLSAQHPRPRVLAPRHTLPYLRLLPLAQRHLPRECPPPTPRLLRHVYQPPRVPRGVAIGLLRLRVGEQRAG